MKLHFIPVPDEAIPSIVKARNWVASKEALRKSGRGLLYGTQRCKFTDDDGAVIHYAYVDRGALHKTRWLGAVERLGDDVSLSG